MIRYFNYDRSKEMQALFKSGQYACRRYGVLQALEMRRLAGLYSLSELRRYRTVLVAQSEWKNCGAVVPQCDFLSRITGYPLFIRSPGIYSSRAAPARACAHSRARRAMPWARLQYVIQSIFKWNKITPINNERKFEVDVCQA